MNLHCMLYLQRKGHLSAQKNKILDIGPQNVYFAKDSEIRDFLAGQGVTDIPPKLADKIQKLEYLSTPRPDERATMFSDITQLTNIEYRGFDVCPAPLTDILDLNYDTLPKKYVGHFDVVLNFGTTEHVFNQWNSFKLIHEAVKLGGVIYCVLPMSAYLQHGFYCYTPLFFTDFCKANGYELADMFMNRAGVDDIRGLGFDIRNEKKLLEPHSAVLAPGEEKVEQYNIHVIMKKLVDKAFDTTLEVSTAHSAVNKDIASRYAASQSRPARKGGLAGLAQDFDAYTGGKYRGATDALRAARRAVKNSKFLKR